MKTEAEVRDRIKTLEDIVKVYESELAEVPKAWLHVGDYAVKKQLITQHKGEIAELKWVLGEDKER